MKWLPVLTFSALALLANACEKHLVSELADEPHHGAAEHQAEPADGVTNANPDKEKKADESKPGEAPKFFPDKK